MALYPLGALTTLCSYIWRAFIGSYKSLTFLAPRSNAENSCQGPCFKAKIMGCTVAWRFLFGILCATFLAAQRHLDCSIHWQHSPTLLWNVYCNFLNFRTVFLTLENGLFYSLFPHKKVKCLFHLHFFSDKDVFFYRWRYCLIKSYPRQSWVFCRDKVIC